MLEFIDNQTIKFVQEGDEDTCGCTGKRYCQPVRFTDETQFQLMANIVNSDPTFGNQYVGWETWDAIIIDIDTIGISAEGECDGEVTVNASAGSGGFEYKIDDSEFQPSNVFSGLCEGTYLITVIDSEGHYASQYVSIILAYDCSTLAGKELFELENTELFELTNCELNDAL